jgi:transcriptional regulator with XRE-family HTH domain
MATADRGGGRPMAEAKYCQEFGNLFRRLRQEAGFTLREFCHRNGFDPANLSKIERGRAKPPTGEALDKYLKALGLEPESAQWYDLHDRAAACAGEIPARLMADEEVVKKLPLVFQTLGSKRPSREALQSLIDLIREA